MEATESLIVDKNGRPFSVEKAGVPNLDPYFFFPVSGGLTLTAADIEKKPYQYSTWIHSAAWVITRNVSRLPIMLVDNLTDKRVDDPKGLLIRLANPNSLMTYTAFLQLVVLNLLLPAQITGRSGGGGQCFIVCRRGDGQNNGKVVLSRGEIPDAMLPYSDDFLKPLTEGTNLKSLGGWIFQAGADAGTKVIYASDEIIRINTANPYDLSLIHI